MARVTTNETRGPPRGFLVMILMETALYSSNKSEVQVSVIGFELIGGRRLRRRRVGVSASPFNSVFSGGGATMTLAIGKAPPN